jgi:DNA-binding transcriptional regulator YhcF (GntR family)
MSNYIVNASWYADVPASKKLVLIFLADSADNEALCWPSVDTITKSTGLNRKTVMAAILYLEKQGFITVQRKNGCGNRYLFKKTVVETHTKIKHRKVVSIRQTKEPEQPKQQNTPEHRLEAAAGGLKSIRAILGAR